MYSYIKTVVTAEIIQPNVASLAQRCLQVTGVMTQGRGDGKEWVTSFMVSHSLDAFNWAYVSDLYDKQRV